MRIHINGAAEHNLQDIDVEFGDGLTVVTGVSGSGKTSLVFDTLYHEARRRFLGVFSIGSDTQRLSPAKVNSITGLGPAIAVGQNLLNRNPTSTLATASGLHPFLRLLYARFGRRHCARCGAGLVVLTEDEIVDRLVSMTRRGVVTVSAPLLRQVRGSHCTLLQMLSAEFGVEAVLVDGQPLRLPQLSSTEPHDVDVRVAQLEEHASAKCSRQAIQTARALGMHALKVCVAEQEYILSFAPVCTACGSWFSDLEPFHFHTPCPHCRGTGCGRCGETGLHPEASAVRFSGLRSADLLACSVDEVSSLFAKAILPASAARLTTEIERRLHALEKVGLGYIALDRPSPTLSRGEAQRTRLAVALTSRLEDLLHVLDEPTVGQHPADVTRLVSAFRELAGPVVFVEHDRVAAAAADRAIDLGPGAGHEGGQLLFTGTPAELWKADTPTGRYFSLHERVSSPEIRPPPEHFLTVRGATLRNLRGIDVPIPIARLTVITGVSGSGKSTLVEDVLAASLTQSAPVGCRAIDGPQLKPVMIDQNPIGQNPRSNPATYTKLADMIRDGFAAATHLSASHFSFNRSEGACPLCKGMGAIEVQMLYLPSTWIRCETCKGGRFSDEVLSAQANFGRRRLSIADFLQLTVDEAIPLLDEGNIFPDKSRQAGARILRTLRDVGLGYLPLGQPSPALSGGEAQRVKLAKYLGRKSLSDQLLILDEPSTGLHPQDVSGLLSVFDRLVRAGATVVVVEHNSDIIRSADWVADLGPGAGPAGGDLLYAGPAENLSDVDASLTGRSLAEETSVSPVTDHGGKEPQHATHIAIRAARAHNLKGVDVDIPKGALTVVTGVSGSGKSSLLRDILEAEAKRRFLETLSLYERQGTHEGPEAPVGAVTGLGVTVALGSERRMHGRRATVGTASEISHHLAALLAQIGERRCRECNVTMRRGREWSCPSCGSTVPIAGPRHFFSTTYGAACTTCHGVGTLRKPNPDKLIVNPEKPLCGGAMYSPGFFPKGYLCKPFNHGYDKVQALAARYDFNPATTPWNEMTPEAQRAFLFGDPEPMPVTQHSRAGRRQTRMETFPGFYGFVRDWDTGGTYTDTLVCPACNGTHLRPEYLAVSLLGHNMPELSEMSFSLLAKVLGNLSIPETEVERIGPTLSTVEKRLRFLIQVGLGYMHLYRPLCTLSAGEAQRVQLAGLMGSGLTGFTVLVDEPSRGLHPAEVGALLDALHQLRDEKVTVIVVEHDPALIRGADHLIDLGPGAGAAGGELVAQGSPQQVARADTVTAAWLRNERSLERIPVRSMVFGLGESRREARGWLIIQGARENNLRGEDVHLPLGKLVGVCGVSGSGKSTLLIDTLGRALAPKKQTTSVAQEPIEPGAHDTIFGAPARTILVDQTKKSIHSPAAFLGLTKLLHIQYADSEDAHALGLSEKELTSRCSVCKGSGSIGLDMSFLPDVYTPCEACRASGYRSEAWEVRLRGLALPELLSLTIDEVYDRWRDETKLARPLEIAREVGLGYLVLRQPAVTLSSGEAQRLKVAKELCRKTPAETLYILDEPTVGQHLEDVARLARVLSRLVDNGHTVVVIEHHTHLLAGCDWLIELGPGGGPDGGHIIATGTPETLALGSTPTAPYLRELMEVKR